MGLYRRGQWWWVSYTIRGRRIHESTKSANRAVAEEIWAKRRAARDKVEKSQRSRIAATRFLEAAGWSDYEALSLLIGSINAAVSQLRKAERPIAGVYIVQSGQFVKIGYSTDVDHRLRELQVGSPHTLKLLAAFPGTPALEQKMHRLFVDDRTRGEWFHLDGVLAAFLNQLSVHELDLSFCDTATVTERKERQTG